jgi:hypothetical protein
MLRLNLIAARNPGNDGARNERPRDKPGFLRVAPAPPSAAGNNLDARWAAVLQHTAHHMFQN